MRCRQGTYDFSRIWLMGAYVETPAVVAPDNHCDRFGDSVINNIWLLNLYIVFSVLLTTITVAVQAT